MASRVLPASLCGSRFQTFIGAVAVFLSHFLSTHAADRVPGSYPELPSETPATFVPVTTRFDFARRSVMIPMRDGVKLSTEILVPRAAKGAPMLLTRTPYDAKKLTSHAESGHLGRVLVGYDNATDVVLEGGYIRVVQDIRGKHGSEGDYVMNRPMRGPLNPTPVDHATDTYDTIEWLVKNVPESNGRVGILGISYDGYLTLTSLIHPHPALKVAVPMNPMVDGWRGDDWFHHGAFRQMNLSYMYDQQATRKSEELWWRDHRDEYEAFLRAGSAGEMGRLHGLEQTGFWRKVLEHPAYDAFWQQQAMDRLLAAEPLQVPVMLVHSLWDQEDIYGDIAVYKALEPKDTANDRVFLVLGPWHHGQAIEEGGKLGALRFPEDTSLRFRREVLLPFLDQYLKDGAPRADVPPVLAYETGENRWRRLNAWPATSSTDRTIKSTPLYLRAGRKLGFAPPTAGDVPFEEYDSDPSKPVPFRSRPILPVGYSDELTWPDWLVDDQREAASRTDVATFVSEPLEAPARISGEPIARLVASTTGTDVDWVVKLIDLYPDEVATEPRMGGYQLMVSADIFRGRYREDSEVPRPVRPEEPLVYRFGLPTASHAFLPGHRIMVQIQSSWFPLYDRNPQTFVTNIFWARPGDYRKATQRIHHSVDHASCVELPLQVTR